MTMVELTVSAKKCLDQYLDRVRLYLKGCKSVDAAEVEADIIEHIEREFASATAAVSYEQLDAVLNRLGSPQQWVPEDELPPWRKVIYRLRTGPEDWRLAYLTLGLLLTGFVVLPSILIMLPASFLVARAALSLSDGEIPKPQRWLIYPTLLAVYIPAALLMHFWPLLFIDLLGDEIWYSYRNSASPLADDLPCWIIAWMAILAAEGLWLAIFSLVQLSCRGFFANLVRPFESFFSPRRIVRRLILGLLLLIISAAAGLLYYRHIIASSPNTDPVTTSQSAGMTPASRHC